MRVAVDHESYDFPSSNLGAPTLDLKAKEYVQCEGCRDLVWKMTCVMMPVPNRKRGLDEYNTYMIYYCHKCYPKFKEVESFWSQF